MRSLQKKEKKNPRQRWEGLQLLLSWHIFVILFGVHGAHQRAVQPRRQLPALQSWERGRGKGRSVVTQKTENWGGGVHVLIAVVGCDIQ